MFIIFRKNKKPDFLVWLVFLIAFFSTAVSAEPDRLRVGFLSPRPPGHAFWGEVVRVMEAVAQDLDIELVIAYNESHSTIGTKRTGDKLLNSEPKLDFFLSGYWVSLTKYHLRLAQERGIKVFIFNSDIVDTEIEEIGLPRSRFKNWIGQMVPDYFTSSKELTKILIEKTRRTKQKKNVDESVSVIAFMAPDISAIARKRNAGLKRQISISEGAVLHETSWDFGSMESWNKDWARDEAVKLLNQYPDVDTIWAANQASAWGAVQAVEQIGKKPGKDIIIGGFDWNSESQKALADGRMTASMFGHFLEGAWALILVHDYYYGYDFADDSGTRIDTPLGALTTDNYESYQKIFAPDFWQEIDFRNFSKKYNPNLKKYNLKIDQFVN